MDMIKSLFSKPEKFMGENIMHYPPLKMFLLYYLISLDFKLVGDCWKIFSYKLKLKYIFFINDSFKDKMLLEVVYVKN